MSTLKLSLTIRRGTKGRRRNVAHAPGTPAPVTPRCGSLHAERKRRQLALAYKIAALIESGELASFSDAAKRIGVTRARVTQIMDLQLLPMAEQERLLGCVRGEG